MTKTNNVMANFSDGEKMETEFPPLSKTDPETDKLIRMALSDKLVGVPHDGITGPIVNVESIHGTQRRNLDKVGLEITGFWVAPDENGEPTNMVQLVINYKEPTE